MNSSEPPAKETSRRNFLRSMAAAPTLALAAGSSLLPQVLPSTQPGSDNRLGEKAPGGPGKFVAIQIGARSFVDEGVDACLDTLQQTGGVNDPRLQVGWHIMHVVTMGPFFSADTSYARLVPFSDFLKPCPYNNCGRPRLAQYIRNVQSTIFRDLAPEQVLDMHYALFGYTGEPPLDQLPTAGLSAETVAIETRRAIEDVNAAIPIYPGIDIDVPTGLNEKRTQPSDVRAATLAALKAGAPGVVLSRKYAEMKLSNIAGARQALENSGAGR